MNENSNNPSIKDDFVKTAPQYELVAFPDESKGTSWTKHGIAWLTKDGKRIKIKLFLDKELPANGKLLLVESIKFPPRSLIEETPF
jgi:hypothetical protein